MPTYEVAGLSHAASVGALKLGCMNRGRGHDVLRDIGLRWEAGINLLSPSRLLGNWNVQIAARTAEEWRERLQEFDLVVLLGRRVSAAFNMSAAAWFTKMGRFALLPHPSGQNRMWNDREAWSLAKEAVKRWQQQ